MWLRKEGIEVWGRRDLSLTHFYHNPLPPVTGRDPGFCKWTPLHPGGRGCGMRRGGSHFESSLGLKNAVVLHECEVAMERNKGMAVKNSGCYWVMLAAKFILCSAGCIITPALNNLVWVESLNGLVALNKAGKETNLLTLTLPPPPPLYKLRLTGLPLIVWSRLINSGASHKVFVAQCASDVCQHTKI